MRKCTREAREAQENVEISQEFRIGFKTSSRAVYTVALQHAPGSWGFVACTLDRDAGIIHLPEPEVGGETGWMAEDNEVGAHQFVVAQASRPFPPELYEAGRDGIRLDRTLLLHFVPNFLRQDERCNCSPGWLRGR